MPERWDCIFVDRIEPDKRIVLTQPSWYGIMHIERGELPDSTQKVRKSIPPRCGPLEGRANDKKVLVAIALASAGNLQHLKSSSGLVVRGFEGQTPYPGLQTALSKTRGEGLRVTGSTGWLVYISPKGEFHCVLPGRLKGPEISVEDSRSINACIKYLLESG